jgi:hypothetical protein
VTEEELATADLIPVGMCDMVKTGWIWTSLVALSHVSESFRRLLVPTNAGRLSEKTKKAA